MILLWDSMNHNEEKEPIMENCSICGFGDDIENMVDCPKYSEDIEKGVIPGWIHIWCCEEDFTDIPEYCIENCDNDIFVSEY